MNMTNEFRALNTLLPLRHRNEIPLFPSHGIYTLAQKLIRVRQHFQWYDIMVRCEINFAKLRSQIGSTALPVKFTESRHMSL